MKFYFKFLVAVVVLLISVPKAFSRFNLEDAEQVDQEERISVETYNDKMSYRYPFLWQRSWDQSLNGFRINAGSLTVNKFDYSQEVKLHSGLGKPAALSLHQYRQEDFVETGGEQEVRISARSPYGSYLGILGDGFSEKEYGDLGAVVGIGESPVGFVEAYYWSVDYYYPTKKNEIEDHMTRETHTRGMRGLWTGSKLQVKFDYEYDHPLVWERKSRGYIYEYYRERLNIESAYGYGAGIVELRSTLEKKNESKGYYGADEIEYRKSLVRRVSETELAFHEGGVDEMLTLGLAHFYRHGAYETFADPSMNVDDYAEGVSPESVHHEWATFFTDYWGRGAHYWQSGFFFNSLLLREDGERWENELKYGLAYEFRFSNNGRVFLNTTWDLDQLEQDFPYSSQAFRPWGGGNIQMQAEF